MKKLTKAQWKMRGIFSGWDLATFSDPPVYISYRPQMTGRAYRSAAWQVIHTKQKSDPQAHFLDYGHKTFTFEFDSPKDKAANDKLIAMAMNFAKEKYGIMEWERGPYGDYYQKGTMDKALRATELKTGVVRLSNTKE